MLIAYLDPGAGSLAIQMIIAGLVTVPYFLRTQISRGINKLRGRDRGKETRDRGA